jgi:hypothetical protein
MTVDVEPVTEPDPTPGHPRHWLLPAGVAVAVTTVLAVILLLRPGTDRTPATASQAAPSGTGQSTAAVAPPAPVLALARQLATTPDNQVTGPVEWVSSTAGGLYRLAGFSTDMRASQPLYIVQLRGRFCCHPGPRGHDPSAPIIVETVTPDGRPGPGVGGVALDLSRLGPVHTFRLP